MEKESTHGKMEVNIQEILCVESEKEKEFGNLTMEIYLKVIIKMMLKMDGENLLGKMDKYTKENS